MNRTLPFFVSILLLGADMTIANARPAQLKTNDYFLSATNPLATADQRDLEREAMALLKELQVMQAREVARARWKTIIAPLNPSPVAWSRFDAFLDEYVLHYTLKALNADPNHPRIVRYNMLPHEWFGHATPGTRQGGGDNMDNTYALIPVERGARYAIDVQRFDPMPADITWSLMGNLLPTMTLAILEGEDMVEGKDGRFTVTLDDKPANGRKNHLQLHPDSRFVFIRESRSDWTQRPAALQVRRLTRPKLPPLTHDQLVARAARYIVDEIPNSYWWVAIMAETPMNAMTPPRGITSLGGLVTQQVSFGRAQLTDDMALVVSVKGGGAAYHSLGVYDFWFNTVEYDRHSSSLNNAQAKPDADGGFTYVIALRDPGVANWIDPAGLAELLLVYRWQGLPQGTADSPALTTRVVSLAGLASALPADTNRITPDERRAMAAERKRQHDLRFAQ